MSECLRPVELCEDKDSTIPNSNNFLCFPLAEPPGLTWSLTSESDLEVDLTISEFPRMKNICA